MSSEAEQQQEELEADRKELVQTAETLSTIINDPIVSFPAPGPSAVRRLVTTVKAALADPESDYYEVKKDIARQMRTIRSTRATLTEMENLLNIRDKDLEGLTEVDDDQVRARGWEGVFNPAGIDNIDLDRRSTLDGRMVDAMKPYAAELGIPVSLLDSPTPEGSLCITLSGKTFTVSRRDVDQLWEDCHSDYRLGRDWQIFRLAADQNSCLRAIRTRELNKLADKWRSLRSGESTVHEMRADQDDTQSTTERCSLM